MTSAVKKIVIKDVEYFIFCEFIEENSFSFYLFNIDNFELYIGFANESNLRCMAAKVRLSFSDFYQDTLCALSSEESENIKFIYTLEKSEDSYVFKWKKVIREGVIITLGTISVNTTDYKKGLHDFMVKMSTLIPNLKIKVKESTNELSETRKEKSEIEALLEETVKAKENIEEEMYSKFLVVLNAKKRKIRELHEQIVELEKKKSKKSINGKTTLKTDASTSKYDDSLNKLGPSTSSKSALGYSFNLDLDDDEKPVIPLCRPRRRKHVVDDNFPEVLDNSKKPVIEDEIKTNLNYGNEETVDGLLDNL